MFGERFSMLYGLRALGLFENQEIIRPFLGGYN